MSNRNFEIGLRLQAPQERIRIETWLLLAFVVAVLWGVAGIFSKMSTPNLGVARVALLIAVVEGIMYSLAYLVWRENVPIGFWDFILAAGSCLIGILGYLCFFEAIMEGQVAIAGTIAAAYPALSVLGAVLIISEKLTWVQSIGVVAIIVGIVSLSYEPHPGSKTAMSGRTLFFALAAFVLWGVWSLTSKLAIDRVGAGNIFGFYVISAVSAPLIYSWFRRVKPAGVAPKNPRRMSWALGAIGLAVNVSGAYAFSFALEQGLASLVVPISSAYPLVTVVLAIAILKERVSRIQVVPLVVVVLGLILVGITV